MKEMFIGIEKVLEDQLDHTLEPLEILCHKDKCDIAKGEVQECHACSPWRKVRPIHILDIGNLIGNNVVVGGVRRTAEIFLCDEDDWECIFAKYGINGIWNEKAHQEMLASLEDLLYDEESDYDIDWLYELKVNDPNARPLHHRRMSNNSICFESKPSNEKLELIFKVLKNEGEPGFINLEAAKRRRPNAKGVNPCGEVLLDSYGVCNLTTVNVMGFVIDGEEGKRLDIQGLLQAQALSTRAGIRMTCLDLELPHWDEIQKRDRLIGTSLTGWQDAIEALDFDKETEIRLLNLLSDCVYAEAFRYCHVLRIPVPLLSTTVKPEGTLSQVANGVSSGLHISYAPFYIRRIRINATDPLVQVALELGWTVNPEIGTPGNDYSEQMVNARTFVIDFPIKSPTSITRNEHDVEKQLDNYFMFQREYTQHNSSNTISVKSDEWEEVIDIIWEKWDEFIGVSFLSFDGGSYELAPYEEITEEEYNTLKSSMKQFNPDLLLKYEVNESNSTEEGLESCDSGACPIR